MFIAHFIFKCCLIFLSLFFNKMFIYINLHSLFWNSTVRLTQKTAYKILIFTLIIVGHPFLFRVCILVMNIPPWLVRACLLVPERHVRLLCWLSNNQIVICWRMIWYFVWQSRREITTIPLLHLLLCILQIVVKNTCLLFF